MLAQYVILGLLMERPMHGYEIKQRFERISGLFWKVSYGSLYPALKKLAESGYIIQQISADLGAPERKVFHLTHLGSDALFAWLREAPVQESVDRNSTNEFLLRLIFFSWLSPEEAREILVSRRKRLEDKWLEVVGKSHEIRSRSDRDYYKSAMYDYIIRAIQTEKKWLDDVLAGKEMPGSWKV